MHHHLLGHLVNLLLSLPASKGEVSSRCTAALILRGDHIMLVIVNIVLAYFIVTFGLIEDITGEEPSTDDANSIES